MKKIFLLFTFALLGTDLLAQKAEQAEELVAEGVKLHDKRDYAGALAKYNKALELDQDNLAALAEKAYTFMAQQKYEEAVAACQRALLMNPNSLESASVYVTYGNAYDELKKPEKALEVYEDGLRKYPNYFMLHFNKGITQTGLKNYDAALGSFQEAAFLNPKHPGSHNALARMLHMTNKRIPALLAYGRFMVLEPEGPRAKGNLTNMQVLTKGDVKKTGKQAITINVDGSMLGDTTADGKPKENSFGTTALLLQLSSALDYDKKNKNETPVAQFQRKFDTVCSSLKETKKDNYGFYWDFYAPYFIEMQEKNQLETFSYLAFASSDEKAVAKWLKSHKKEIDKFYEWSSAYNWPENK